MAHYNIFISHAWKYSEHYEKVVKWLNEAKDDGEFTWSNYSASYDNPVVDPDKAENKKKLKEELKGQISPASKVIVLAGMYVAHSEWIDYEIDTAVDYSKYIIGLKPWGQERIPTKVSDNADVMVGWNKSSLISAIKNS